MKLTCIVRVLYRGEGQDEMMSKKIRTDLYTIANRSDEKIFKDIIIFPMTPSVKY